MPCHQVRDFDGCFGIIAMHDGDELEKLLMPPSGPTATDEQMIDASSDEGSLLDWEEDEEEDFEDDEDFGMPGMPGMPFSWTNPSSD